MMLCGMPQIMVGEKSYDVSSMLADNNSEIDGLGQVLAEGKSIVSMQMQANFMKINILNGSKHVVNGEKEISYCWKRRT
jgi:hypothetical protein